MIDWSDAYKIFSYAFKEDPISTKEIDRDTSVGITHPDANIDVRADGSFWGGGNKSLVRWRDTTDFIDLSSVTNRKSRYQEYERLRNTPEIESALNIFADETCLAGNTKIATPFGYFTIKELAETKQPDERFLVYCFDRKKMDYSLGWAYHPRLVKRERTIEIVFDTGEKLVCTPDHKLLLKNGQWIEAYKTKLGDEFMPFHRAKAIKDKSKIKTNQYARIYTQANGWMTERQLVDEWRAGKKLSRYKEITNKVVNYITKGLSAEEAGNLLKVDPYPIIKRYGTSATEIKELNKRYPDRKRVLSILPGEIIDVYDMSVEEHANFATDTIIVHNCQVGDNKHTFEINIKDDKVRKELESLFFRQLQVDRKIWNWAKQLFLNGDFFLEVVIDSQNPNDGILTVKPLPADSMYRIETVKGRLIEFQQSREGPDYNSLARVEVTQATDADLQTATALRFTPEQIIHFRIGDDRKTFYPYGVSMIEAARGPAHQLRLAEESMLIYRLCRSPERKVFYVDVGQLTPSKAEAFMERMKDQLRKKKVYSNRGTPTANMNPVEERWHAPAMDEDIWVPTRPNSNTRIETLPGVQIGEQDDVVYFRDKLYVALGVPKTYMAPQDIQINKQTLSSQDVIFARVVERLQLSLEDGLFSIAERHLQLQGFPYEMWEDLEIKMTVPSNYRERELNEIQSIRYSNAGSLKSAGIMSDYDIYVDILQVPDSKAKDYVARNKLQKIEDAKIQAMSANPELLGIGQPGDDSNEIGAEAGGPNPMLGGENNELPPTQQETNPKEETDEGGPKGKSKKKEFKPIPEPNKEDIKKYDLEIKDYSRDKDQEEVDPNEVIL